MKMLTLIIFQKSLKRKDKFYNYDNLKCIYVVNIFPGIWQYIIFLLEERDVLGKITQKALSLYYKANQQNKIIISYFKNWFLREEATGHELLSFWFQKFYRYVFLFVYLKNLDYVSKSWFKGWKMQFPTNKLNLQKV